MNNHVSNSTKHIRERMRILFIDMEKSLFVFWGLLVHIKYDFNLGSYKRDFISVLYSCFFIGGSTTNDIGKK